MLTNLAMREMKFVYTAFHLTASDLYRGYSSYLEYQLLRVCICLSVVSLSTFQQA